MCMEKIIGYLLIILVLVLAVNPIRSVYQTAVKYPIPNRKYGGRYSAAGFASVLCIVGIIIFGIYAVLIEPDIARYCCDN